jgi:hypothetical protein
MEAQQTSCSRTTLPASNSDPVPAAWILRLFGDRRPLGFQAGDDNLYRYVQNQPVNSTDPSGLRVLSISVVDPLPQNLQGLFLRPGPPQGMFDTIMAPVCTVRMGRSSTIASQLLIDTMFAQRRLRRPTGVERDLIERIQAADAALTQGLRRIIAIVRSLTLQYVEAHWRPVLRDAASRERYLTYQRQVVASLQAIQAAVQRGYNVVFQANGSITPDGYFMGENTLGRTSPGDFRADGGNTIRLGSLWVTRSRPQQEATIFHELCHMVLNIRSHIFPDSGPDRYFQNVAWWERFYDWRLSPPESAVEDRMMELYWNLPPPHLLD